MPPGFFPLCAHDRPTGYDQSSLAFALQLSIPRPRNFEKVWCFIQTTPCLKMASKGFLACVESQTLWFCCKLALSE